VGWGAIAAREGALAAAARAAWLRHPRVRILGDDGGGAAGAGAPRLPIVSFVVAASDAPGAPLLHWGFVAALLNDVFGIQARGGCLCVGL
jgi:tRNA 2-thiocytidine biosynthesis protein TtcA